MFKVNRSNYVRSIVTIATITPKISEKYQNIYKLPKSSISSVSNEATFFVAADCPDPNCSGHGACFSGKCYCKAGWQGERCNQVDQQVYQCLPRCSDHGTYDLESATCICEGHWTGVDCSQPSCGLDCGPHGTCEQGLCKLVCLSHTLYRSGSFHFEHFATVSHGN